MEKDPKFIEWLDSLKLEKYTFPSVEKLEKLRPQLDPYPFEKLASTAAWMMDYANSYSGNRYTLLVYAMKMRDIRRTTEFFSQPVFWFEKKYYPDFLETMVHLQIPIEPAVLEKALKNLQEKKPEDRLSRKWNQEKIGYVLALMKIHGGAENLARVQAAEESDAWSTVEVLLKDRLYQAKIFDPGSDPWFFLDKYGGDPDHLEKTRKELRTAFAIFEFDTHICGDGLLVFDEHHYYGKDPFMPLDFAEFLQIIGDEEMADLMTRFNPVYIRYCDPDIEMTDEEWKSGQRPFEDEYFERNTKMRVLAYRYILNHPEVFREDDAV